MEQQPHKHSHSFGFSLQNIDVNKSLTLKHHIYILNI